MPIDLREFVLEDTGASDGQPWRLVAEALGSRFRIVPDGSRTVRRVWLDTFDRRMSRTGAALEYVSGPAGHEMTLVTPAGERVTAEVAGMRWPMPAAHLPGGRIRDGVAAIAGIRALLPVVAGRSTQCRLRVLDGEEKTVARLTIDDFSPQAPAVTGPRPRLTITAVRGYEGPARRVARLLAGLAGITPAAESAFVSALAAAGVAAGPPGGPAVRLTATMPADTAVAALLLRLLDIAEANVSGVVRDIDTEFLHDLRIAVRRTRSALKLLGDALPGDLAARFAPEFRWLGQLTTPTRDLDVHLLGFDVAAAGLVTAAPHDLLPLRESLARCRDAEHRRLVRGLRSVRFAGLIRDWRAALNAAAPAASPGGAAGLTAALDRAAAAGEAAPPGPRAARVAADRARRPIADLASTRVRRAYRRLARSGAAITSASSEQDLHEVRKRGKELRYLLEFFTSLHDPALHRSAVRELKDLQDCLGAIQDGHVQREMIRTLADRMMAEQAAPAATLLAMGELAAQHDAAASRARDEFGTRFARFARSRNERTMTALTAAGAA